MLGYCLLLATSFTMKQQSAVPVSSEKGEGRAPLGQRFGGRCNRRGTRLPWTRNPREEVTDAVHPKVLNDYISHSLVPVGLFMGFCYLGRGGHTCHPLVRLPFF